MCRAIAALFAIAGTALFAQPVEFEVASVRPHAAGVPASYPPIGGVGTGDPERIAYNGFTLKALIGDAGTTGAEAGTRENSNRFYRH